MNLRTSGYAYWLALSGHSLLLACVVSWHAWIAPPEALPRVLPILFLGLPLIVLLRGLVKASVSAYQISCLAALVYFALGITNVINMAGQEAVYGAAQILASSLWFAGCISALRNA